MKKRIFIPALVLGVVAVMMSLKAEAPEAIRVIVQTDLVPVPVMESFGPGAPGHGGVMWVKTGGSRAKDISFYTDEESLANILQKLVHLTRGHTRISNGEAVPCSWHMEKKDNTTFLNLVYQVQFPRTRSEGGC